METPTVIKPDKIEWKPVGKFKVDGRRVYIGDSWMVLSQSVDVPVTPGLYDIDVKIHYYGSDDRVALLRGRLLGSTTDGERDAGEFGVDVASAGVIDADAMDRWVAGDEKGYETWQDAFCDGGQGNEYAGFFPCEPIGSSMLYTSTGFGDGGYMAVTLLEGEKPVGFELRFLDDEGFVAAPPYQPSWMMKFVIGPIFFVLLLPFMLLGKLVRWSNKLSRPK